MFLNVSQAAKLAGVTRNTIYRALKSGRMSQTERGIDLAELERCFGPLKADTAQQPEAVRDAQQEQILSVMAEHSAMLREQLEFTKAQLEAAQERERRLLDIVEQQSRLLAHQPAQEQQHQHEPARQEGGLFGWLNRR
jgi:hypothetical protein